MTTEPMTTDNAYRWIEGINRSAHELAEATNRESYLEDLRAIRKVEAIRRIMAGGPNDLTGKPHSSSSAEAIVETDEKYFAHRGEQRAAVQATIQARGHYEAMKLKARLAVERWTVECSDDPKDNPHTHEGAVSPGDPTSPVYRGLPWATLRTNPDGSIGAVDLDVKDSIGEPEKKAKAMETIRRTARRNPEEVTSNQDLTDDR